MSLHTSAASTNANDGDLSTYASIGSEVANGNGYTTGGASVDWLIPGMVIACGTVDTSTAQPEWCTVRVESVIDSGAYSTATVKTTAKASAAA